MKLLLDTQLLLWAAAHPKRLVAQAICEGITLVTSDAVVAKYPGPIRRV